MGSSDFIKGLFTAVIAAVVVAIVSALHSVFAVPDFDILTVDWPLVLHTMLNAAILAAEGAFAGYIGKNLLSDENGAVLGRWGGDEQ